MAEPDESTSGEGEHAAAADTPKLVEQSRQVSEPGSPGWTVDLRRWPRRETVKVNEARTRADLALCLVIAWLVANGFVLWAIVHEWTTFEDVKDLMYNFTTIVIVVVGYYFSSKR